MHYLPNWKWIHNDRPPAYNGDVDGSNAQSDAKARANLNYSPLAPNGRLVERAARGDVDKLKPRLASALERHAKVTPRAIDARFHFGNGRRYGALAVIVTRRADDEMLRRTLSTPRAVDHPIAKTFIRVKVPPNGDVDVVPRQQRLDGISNHAPSLAIPGPI